MSYVIWSKDIWEKCMQTSMNEVANCFNKWIWPAFKYMQEIHILWNSHERWCSVINLWMLLEDLLKSPKFWNSLPVWLYKSSSFFKIFSGEIFLFSITVRVLNPDHFRVCSYRHDIMLTKLYYFTSIIDSKIYFPNCLFYMYIIIIKWIYRVFR